MDTDACKCIDYVQYDRCNAINIPHFHSVFDLRPTHTSIDSVSLVRDSTSELWKGHRR